MTNGAFIIARKIMDSEIWQEKPSWWLKVWLYLIAQANHTNRGKYKKGSLLTSMPEVYEACKLKNDGVTESSLKNVFKWLKQTTQITTQKTTRGMWVFISNYDKYQNLTTYRNSTENYTENSIGTPQELYDKQQLNNETNNIYDPEEAIKEGEEEKPKESGKTKAKKKTPKYKPVDTEYMDGLKERFPNVDIPQFWEDVKLKQAARGKKIVNERATLLNWLTNDEKWSKERKQQQSKPREYTATAVDKEGKEHILRSSTPIEPGSYFSEYGLVTVK